MLAFTSVREDVPVEEVTRDLERLSHEAQAADQPALAAAVLKAQDALGKARDADRHRQRARRAVRSAGRFRRDLDRAARASRRSARRCRSRRWRRSRWSRTSSTTTRCARSSSRKRARSSRRRAAASAELHASPDDLEPADDAAPRLPHAQGQLAHGRAEGVRRGGLGRASSSSTRSSPSSAPPSRRCSSSPTGCSAISAPGSRTSPRIAPASATSARSRPRPPSWPARAGARAARPTSRCRSACPPTCRAAPISTSARPSPAPPRSRAADEAERPVVRARPVQPRPVGRARDRRRARARSPAPTPADASAMFDRFDDARSADAADDAHERGVRGRCRRRWSTSISAARLTRRADPEPGAERRRGPRARSDLAGCASISSSGEAGRAARADAAGAVDLEIDADAAQRGEPLERRARQGRRSAADRHSALQHLPQRGRRAVAPPHDRGRRMGDGAAPPGRRSADRAGAFARRQLGDGRLHRPLAARALARACARAHPGHRPRHRRRSAPVRQRRRGDPPPAAPVRRRLPAASRRPSCSRAWPSTRSARRMRLEAATAASELAEGQDSESPIEPAIAVEPLLTLEGIDDAPAANDSYAEGAPVGQGRSPRRAMTPQATAPARWTTTRHRQRRGRRGAGVACGRRAGACRRRLRPPKPAPSRRRRARQTTVADDPRRAPEPAPSIFGGLGSFNALGVAELKPLAAAPVEAGRAGAGAGVDLRRGRRRDRRDRCGRPRAVPDLRGRSAGAAAQARRPAARLAAASPRDHAHAAACMRTLHTLKGGARLAGAMRLGEMAHRLETRIERLTATDAPATSARTSRRCRRSPTR